MLLPDRYSPGVWPQTPLPWPRLRREPVELDGDWIRRVYDRGPSSFELAPAELHLRAMRDVELDNPASLLEVCAAVGFPLDPIAPWRGLTDVGMSPSVAERHYRAQVKHAAAQLGLPTPVWSRRRKGDRVVHVAEVALRAFWVRLLVDHVYAWMNDESVAQVWQSKGFFERGGFLDDIDDQIARVFGQKAADEERPDDYAWFLFASYLNEGLAAFQPRVVATIESEPDLSDVVDAYSASCLAIFNDLLDGGPEYRRCADETCGRLFHYQVGRGSGTAPRSDAKFCSPQHARAQSQRLRRRAERANKRRPNGQH